MATWIVLVLDAIREGPRRDSPLGCRDNVGGVITTLDGDPEHFLASPDARVGQPPPYRKGLRRMLGAGGTDESRSTRGGLWGSYGAGSADVCPHTVNCEPRGHAPGGNLGGGTTIRALASLWRAISGEHASHVQRRNFFGWHRPSGVVQVVMPPPERIVSS